MKRRVRAGLRGGRLPRATCEVLDAEPHAILQVLKETAQQPDAESARIAIMSDSENA